MRNNAEIEKQLAFEKAAKRLLRTRRSNGNDLATLDDKRVNAQPITSEHRRNVRLQKNTLAAVNANEIQPTVTHEAQSRPYHGQIFTKEELFDLRPSEEGYEYNDPFLEVPLAPWDEDDDEFQYNELPTKLNVSAKNKARLDTIIARHSSIFSTEVSKEPATGVAPFELKS